METMYKLSKDFDSGLLDLYKKNGLKTLCDEIDKRVSEKKTEILLAWFAEHGFEPGKAVLVQQNTCDGFKVFIREATEQELLDIKKA